MYVAARRLEIPVCQLEIRLRVVCASPRAKHQSEIANPRDCDVEDTGDVRLFTTKTHCKYVFINTESTDAAAANLAEARRGFFYEERIPF
ncbi:hypothetical protein F2P81_015175 [Scophthalmus maximus]|uniref:Uncharacterized protein n=1 Tax=Scophthalmus maximus TaxID=52904 RepID=A0A6A4SK36_SCOMX|nr:hypothetical protein F2P81_015175 [Scophthalmus maximus]